MALTCAVRSRRASLRRTRGVKIGPGLTCLSLASARSRQVPLSDDWNGQINSADHPFLPPPSLPMFRRTLGSLGVAGWLPCWGYTVFSRKWGTWIWVGSDIASGRTLRLLLASCCCFLEPFPNTQAAQGAPQTQSVSGPLPLPAWTCLNLSAVLSARRRPHVIEGAERQNRGQSQCPSPLSTAPLGPNPPGPPGTPCRGAVSAGQMARQMQARIIACSRLQYLTWERQAVA